MVCNLEIWLQKLKPCRFTIFNSRSSTMISHNGYFNIGSDVYQMLVKLFTRDREKIIHGLIKMAIKLIPRISDGQMFSLCAMSFYPFNKPIIYHKHLLGVKTCITDVHRKISLSEMIFWRRARCNNNILNFFQFNYHVINQQKLIKSDLFHSEINYWFEMFIFYKIIFSNKFDLFFSGQELYSYIKFNTDFYPSQVTTAQRQSA